MEHKIDGTLNPEFMTVVIEVIRMHAKKGADYGSDEDFFANVVQSKDWGVAPWVGTMIRLNDKVTRLQKAANGGPLENEGIEDSLLDIATYAIIATCLFRRESSLPL